MKKLKLRKVNKGFLCIVFIFSLAGCSGFFGTKTDLSFIPVPDTTVKEVAYVPIQPVINGFANISDIIIGYDELIYVVDAGTEEIISYDLAFNRLASITIPGVTRIAQDRRLDLLAIGVTDTIINATTYQLSTIYRIDPKQTTYGLSLAVVKDRIIHPFYLGTNISVRPTDNQVKFTGIAVAGFSSSSIGIGNTFYVTRTGPNATNLVGGPDDAVLLFGPDDIYNYYVQVNTESQGLRNDFFKKPVGIVNFVQPPQTNKIDDMGFTVISNSLSEPLKAKAMSYQLVDNSPYYTLDQSLVVGDTSKADGFLYTPGRFTNPTDIAYSGDGTELYFITDGTKDSLFVFSKTGLEGVLPPARSKSKKRVKVSFGGIGQGLYQFDNPVAVAYYNKIVYIADAGNHRLMRFKLTTDFN